MTKPEPGPTTPAATRRRLIPGLTPTTLAIACLWVAMVLLSYFLKERTGTDLGICMFRRLTGEPCATCRGTRAAVRLAHADLAGAWAFNPLVTVFLIAGPLWLLWRVARPPRPPFRRAVRRTLLALFLAALAANWWYVVVAEHRQTQADPSAVQPVPQAAPVPTGRQPGGQ